MGPGMATMAAATAAPPVNLPTHRRWIWIAAAGVAVLAAGGTTALVLQRKHHAKTPTSQYETVKADRGRIVARVTATGTLSALVTVQVGSQVSGRIQSLSADFNSLVRKGQVIARIDPQLYAAAVEQNQANVASLQGQLEAARATAANNQLVHARLRSLRAQSLVSQQDDDNARAAADVARAQVAALEGQLKQARAALHQARINLAYTNIVSPTDGIVIARNVDVGQTVAAAFQAPTLFVIAEDLRKMQVDTSVAEADVGKLTADMPATFTVDAYGSELFRGVVRQVRNNPQTVQNVVTYDAVIDVGNDRLKLKPGMTANVTFVYGEAADVLRVPNSALRFRAPEAWTAGKPRPAEAAGRRTVWALRDGAPVPLSIRMGMTDGVLTEVLEGEVRPGEVLITDAGGTSSVPPAMRRVL